MTGPKATVVPARFRLPVKARSIDATLAVAAMLAAAYTLPYPYGRDQGLMHYVGREWFLRGAVPYRDLAEHRPPGMHVLFGLCAAVFGDVMWPIRVMDLFLTALLGITCALLLTKRGESPRPGSTGIAILAAVLFHYGFFDFWNTAQIDYAASVVVMLSLAWAYRARHTRTALVGSALTLGVALLFKPPALVLGMALPALWWRRCREDASLDRRQRRRWLAAAAACIPLPLVAVILAFASVGAADDFLVWNVEVNAFYAQHERWLKTTADVWHASADVAIRYAPYSLMLPVAVAVVAFATPPDRRRAHLRAYAGPFGLLLLAMMGALVQLKAYPYHFAAVVGPLVLLTGRLFLDWQELPSGPSSSLARTCAFAAALVLPFPLSRGAERNVLRPARAAWELATGETDRLGYVSRFDFWDFNPAGSQLVGEWLRQHSSPDDSVAVRSFEPQIYIIARRRYDGRFFWTPFVSNPHRAVRRSEWFLEVVDTMRSRPPRFVVAFPRNRSAIENTRWYLYLGYEQRLRVGEFAILERPRRRVVK